MHAGGTNLCDQGGIGVDQDIRTMHAARAQTARASSTYSRTGRRFARNCIKRIPAANACSSRAKKIRAGFGRDQVAVRQACRHVTMERLAAGKVKSGRRAGATHWKGCPSRPCGSPPNVVTRQTSSSTDLPGYRYGMRINGRAARHLDTEFFVQFAPQGIQHDLARLDLAARKLPQAALMRLRMPQTDRAPRRAR
jgi:hypothetical protein